jgi:hypothetical protein
MAKEWTGMGVEEKIEWLRVAIESLETSVGATQDDLFSLSRRLVELDLQQRSAFELVTELTATVERMDAGQ